MMKFLSLLSDKMRIWPFTLISGPYVEKAENSQGLTSIDALQMDNVVFGSEYLRRKFHAEGIDPLNAQVVHYGVDLSKFHFKQRPPNDTGHYKLLFIGRLTEGKGAHVLLQAIKILNEGNKTGHIYELTVIGEGEEEYTQSLVNYLRDNRLEKLVTLCGKASREDISSCYHHHDLFVFPSLWEEPFGIVVIEAMACGIPVVSTAVGGTGEIVQDGINTVVCKADDPNDLAVKISRILSNDALREKMVLNAYDTVKFKFIQQRAIDAIENVLSNTAKREQQ